MYYEMLILPHLTKRLVSILAALVAVLLLIFAVRAVHHIKSGDHKTTSEKPIDEDLAAEQDGVMSRQQHRKLMTIRLAIHQSPSRIISDRDVNWLLQMLDTPAPNPSPLKETLRRMGVMSVLESVKHYTPAQANKVFNSTVSFLSPPDQPERNSALAVMRATKDKRAIPIVTTFLNDPDPETRKVAQWALDSLSKTSEN